jgi:hypothetical protein
VTSDRAKGVRLMHEHINILPAALVAPQAAHKASYREIIAEPLRQFTRSQH